MIIKLTMSSSCLKYPSPTMDRMMFRLNPSSSDCTTLSLCLIRNRSISPAVSEPYLVYASYNSDCTETLWKHTKPFNYHRENKLNYKILVEKAISLLFTKKKYFLKNGCWPHRKLQKIKQLFIILSEFLRPDEVLYSE